MTTNEMFSSAMRSAQDRAGVFEYDGEVGYFYLYDTRGTKDQKVMSAIRVLSGAPDFEEHDVEILWNSTENKVGLFIKGELWAAFDARAGEKYGGNYRSGIQTSIPPDIVDQFGRR